MPDPDTGRPAELAGLTGEELEALVTTPFRPPGQSWPAGIVPPSGWPLPAGLLPRDGSGGGCGFADGGALDTAAPGVALAAHAEDAHTGLESLDDDALVGVIRAWRRLASWANGRELAAVAELARRRPADGTPPEPACPGGFPEILSEFIPEEIAAALTLTGRAAAAWQELVRVRALTCTYPGCRRPAARCDLDHTIPYEKHGITCGCNLAPLCRRHHRLKQAECWTLEQPSAGVMAWLTPAGRRYLTLPSHYPE